MIFTVFIFTTASLTSGCDSKHGWRETLGWVPTVCGGVCQPGVGVHLRQACNLLLLLHSIRGDNYPTASGAEAGVGTSGGLELP